VVFAADDALAAAAAVAARDARVARILICTPDKDLAQCVDGTRVVQFDRRARQVRDEDGVRAKFGVSPVSIPDYLALVGDSADGYPGLPGWGAKSASAVLAAYTHLEAIPPAASKWSVPVRGAATLSATLEAHRAEASLFRELATLRLDAPTIATVDDLEWRGPRPEFEGIAQTLGLPSLFSRARGLAARR
jgi:5'-3' exonuclease